MKAEERSRYLGQTVVVFKFAIGDRVLIKDCDCKGTVYSMCVSKDGIEYSVKWFNEAGTRCWDWFNAKEIEAA